MGVKMMNTAILEIIKVPHQGTTPRAARRKEPPHAQVVMMASAMVGHAMVGALSALRP